MLRTKRYNGMTGWISTKVKAPKPGTFAWKLNTKLTGLHVRSGAHRRSPVIHMRDGDDLVVVASLLGSPRNRPGTTTCARIPTMSRSTSAAGAERFARVRPPARRPPGCGHASSTPTRPTTNTQRGPTASSRS